MLGILCGFAAEKKIAHKLSPLVAMSGAHEAGARAAAQRLIDAGATSLLSFGVAGGLARGLNARSVIIGTAVIDRDGKKFTCATDIVERFANAAPHAHKGNVFGSDTIIDTAAEKERLARDFGALIVDMESHILAQAATAHNLPFGVLRGVSDDADAPLPPAVLHGINPDGSENIPGVLLSLAKDMRQLPSLLHFARNTGTALNALDKVIRASQPAP